MRQIYKYIGNMTLLMFCFLIFFIFNITLPFVSDDIAMQNSTLEFGIGNFSFFNLPYFNHNGRFGENLYFLLAQIGPFNLDILNSIAGVIYIFLFYFLVFLRLPSNRKDFFIFLFIIFFIICFCPVSNFVWLSASFNYIWAVILIMLYILPFRIIINKILDSTKSENTQAQNKSSNIFFIIIFSPIAFFAGIASELNIILIALCLLFIIYALIKKYKIPLWLKLGIILFIAGYVCLYFSPGVAIRSNYMQVRSIIDIFNSGELFKYILNSLIGLNGKGYRFFIGLLVLITILYFKPELKKIQLLAALILSFICILMTDIYTLFGHILGLVIFIALIVHAFIKKCNRAKVTTLLTLFLIFLSVGVITLQLGSIPSRALLMPYLLLIAILSVLISIIYLNLKYKKGFIIIMSLSLLIHFTYIEATYYLFNSNWNKVEIEIKENKNNGLDYVKIKKDIFIYGNYIGGWGNVEEGDDWANIAYRKYYGLNKIILY